MLYYEIAEEEIWRKFDYSVLENPPEELILRELELISTSLDLVRYPGGYQQQIEMGV